MKRIKEWYLSHTLGFFRFSVIFLATSTLLFLLCCLSTSVADFVNETLSTAVRFLLAKLFNFLPFSMGEFLLIAAVVLLFILLIVLIFFCHTSESSTKLISFVLGVTFTVLSLHALTLAIPYHTTTLDKKLNLEKSPVTTEELISTANIMLDEVNALSKKLEYDENGSSVIPYTLNELSEKICKAYDTVNEKYDLCTNFQTHIKPVTFSRAMSYLHFVGIYTFYSGESNLNVNYPSYNFSQTTAHEFAHQRGIIRENEANFTAFLVCISSDDDYIRYSGYLNTLLYVIDALYEASPEEYSKIIQKMNSAVLGELRAEAKHAKQYENTKIGEISQKANDAYLKIQGTEEGAKSYGLVVDLAVAYYRTVE